MTLKRINELMQSGLNQLPHPERLDGGNPFTHGVIMP